MVDLRVLLDEGHHRAVALEADPAALAPPDPDRSARTRCVDYLDCHPAVTSRDHPATRTPGRWIAGLDFEHRPGPGLRDDRQMKAVEAQEKVASVAAIERVMQTQLWLGIVEVLEISGGRSRLIVGDLDVYPQLPRTTGAPIVNSEEPKQPYVWARGGVPVQRLSRPVLRNRSAVAELIGHGVEPRRPAVMSTVARSTG